MNNKQFLEILLAENKEMSEKIKRMEELASQMEQSNVRYLNELKRTQIRVDDSGVKKVLIRLEMWLKMQIKRLIERKKGLILHCIRLSFVRLG
ncbi:hypothetical protein OBK24_12490 [Empedobacter falsenii]